MTKTAIALIIVIILLLVVFGVMWGRTRRTIVAADLAKEKLPAAYVTTANYLKSANTWKWNINDNSSVANVMLTINDDNTFNINAVIPTPSYGMPKNFGVTGGKVEVTFDGFLQLPLPSNTGNDNFMQINYSTELGVAKVVFVWNGRYGLGTLIKDV